MLETWVTKLSLEGSCQYPQKKKKVTASQEPSASSRVIPSPAWTWPKSIGVHLPFQVMLFFSYIPTTLKTSILSKALIPPGASQRFYVTHFTIYNPCGKSESSWIRCVLLQSCSYKVSRKNILKINDPLVSVLQFPVKIVFIEHTDKKEARDAHVHHLDSKITALV